MRYALISDIHANLPALEAVLEEIGRRRDVDAIYHVGDLVGYAPWPNEVVERLHDSGIEGVSGNYDSTVASDYKHCGCRYEDARQEELSHASYAWTRANVSGQTKAALGQLPFRLDLRPMGGHVTGPTIILVHGTPINNVTYWTEDRADDFCTKMGNAAGARAGDVIAFGHTHKPWQRAIGGVQFVNAGSVGRPKDGDPRAGYVHLDVGETGTRVELRRVEYDVERVARAIAASTLPDELADHLRTGGAWLAGAGERPIVSLGTRRGKPQ